MSYIRSSDTTKFNTVTPFNSNTIKSTITTIPSSKDSQFTSNSQTQTSEFSKESSSQLLQQVVSEETTEIPGIIVTNKSSALFVTAVYIITATFIASLL